MGGACSSVISSNPADVILLVFAFLVLIIFCWCIWAFFYAIFLFIFSKWDDNKVKSAWNSIRYMIIWIFLTVMLLFAWPTLLRLFGMPNPENYSARKIFTKIWSVITCLSTGVVTVVKDPANNSPFEWLDSFSAWNSDDLTSYDDEPFVFDEL